VANTDVRVMENSANTESWVMKNLVHTENRVVQDWGGGGVKKSKQGKGVAPSKRPAPRWCPRGITKTQKMHIAKDASKSVGREKRRGRAGLLV
jgi:hypothetical protein